MKITQDYIGACRLLQGGLYTWDVKKTDYTQLKDCTAWTLTQSTQAITQKLNVQESTTQRRFEVVSLTPTLACRLPVLESHRSFVQPIQSWDGEGSLQ